MHVSWFVFLLVICSVNTKNMRKAETYNAHHAVPFCGLRWLVWQFGYGNTKARKYRPTGIKPSSVK